MNEKKNQKTVNLDPTDQIQMNFLIEDSDLTVLPASETLQRIQLGASYALISRLPSFFSPPPCWGGLIFIF